MQRNLTIILLITCCLLSGLLKGQGQLNIDSLKKELSKAAVDSATLKKYLVIAVNKLQSNNTPAKLAIFDWMIAASKQHKFQQYEANGYHWKGVAYMANGQSDSALECYLKALEFARSIGYASIENNANIGIGSFYFNNEQYDRALPYFEHAIEISKKNNFTAALASAYLNIANVIYGATERSPNPKYDEVITYMKLSGEVAEKRKDTAILIKANMGIASMYNIKKDYQQSDFFLQRVEPYLQSASWEHLASNVYGNMGELYRLRKNFRSAINNFEKGLVVLKKYPDPDMEYKYYAALADLYSENGDYENAFKHQLKYSALHDSLLSKDKYDKSAELENKYQQLFKNKEIERLKTAQRIKQLQLEKQQAVITGNLLEAKRKEDEIVLLTQARELQELQLFKQNELLSKSALQAIADSQQIQLVNQSVLLKEKQIVNQQQTRNYLIGGLALFGILSFFLFRNVLAKRKAYLQLQLRSQQIKDQALQLSKQAKQIAQFQSQMNPHFVYNALHNIQGLVLTNEKQKANSQIQSLAHLMRKTFANADKEDITLEEEINYLNKYIEFEKTVFGDNLGFEVQVSKEAEGAILPPMMIQPFIENSIKHANLHAVEHPLIKVLIETENNLLSINIFDNGSGIKYDESKADKLSHSLSVIKSRLDLLFKGNADANNQPLFLVQTMPEISAGTRIKFYLPLNYSF